ncbi:iron-containing alcohol dehydrogenase [Parabacteroides sp. PF5-6]|uniref:iron-containing alcohol dehydrogenase n=1 Tax=Parabacteroides sp. PF5-6 TaxID=1742403 RepID=UPI00240612DB|nr:iron-containing alcohol dehydrogenase [Parabacteroides sp. PF5-6]MDF9829143.1 3-dehydroquinate synthase [Parabacteroides sp. PF5-6]
MARQQVVIVKDLKTELSDFLASLTFNKLFILTDENTKRACLPLLQDIPAIKEATLITVEAGDTHKDIEHLAHIWMRLSTEGASRDSLLINLGGGMITDMGGFAGATFKRGIRTINIPTTLMASVDAAVGGKTGINFNGLKNEIGSFYPPLCVFIDCGFLQTLDADNILSGYAEMIKHALISSEKVLAPLLQFDLNTLFSNVHTAEQLSTLNSQLSTLVSESVAVKENIVEQDPKEKGIRKALNFGHTIGHAFESLSFTRQRPILHGHASESLSSAQRPILHGHASESLSSTQRPILHGHASESLSSAQHPILHGHAVAAGMICELYLSHKTCGFPSEKLSRILYYIKEYYPPFAYDCKDYERLYEYMTHDKKNEGGIINFTLLANIGDVRINQEVSKEKILESLDFYRESFGF